MKQEEVVHGADFIVRGNLKREKKSKKRRFEKRADFWRWYVPPKHHCRVHWWVVPVPPKHRWRVDEHLLRQRIPKEAELRAVENAQAAAEAAVIAEWGEAASRGGPFRSFRSLQAAFLCEYGSAIRRELGQDVTLEPADISESVQNKFMGRVTTNGRGMLPTFGYHGTKNSNIPSILSRGLLVPGQKSGISVAHGSSHGVGIYTGLPGAAGLSRVFCDSSNMLICGAVDPDAKPITNVEKSTVAPQVHKNHRWQYSVRRARRGQQAWPCEDRENAVLRVAGAARIFFDDSFVTPLFIAQQRTATSAVPNPGPWAPVPTRAGLPTREEVLFSKAIDPNTNAAGHVWVGRQRTFIEKSGERVWSPPEPSRGWNEIHVKRRAVAKERDRKRAGERKAKSSQALGIAQ